MPTGTTAAWQLNTPVQPLLQGDSIVAGALVVKPLDGDAQIRILEWNKLRGDAEWKAEFPAGWKIVLTRPASAMDFAVRLRVNAPSTWKPVSIRGRAEMPPGRTPFRLEFRRGKPASITLHVNAVGAQILSLQLYDCRGRKTGPKLSRAVSAGPLILTWPIPDLDAEGLFAMVDANGTRRVGRLSVR